MPKVEIFADGSCLGNPGPGGWGAILRTPEGEKEFSGGKTHTTNNIMELTAVIEPLRTIKEPSVITVTTDSQYVQKGMTEWITGWIKNGWKTAGRKPVKNRELWEEMHKLASPHKITWKWIRGHNGHPENERCDVLANSAAMKFK